MKTFTYEIEGVRYRQTPVVLGQIPQIAAALDGIEGNFDDLNGFINAAGDRLPTLLAVVLTPEGVSLKDKDIDAVAEDLRFAADIATIEKVVDDFFTCNPISSVLERVEAATGAVGNIVGRVALRMMSSVSSSSWQEATSRNETQSSGESEPTK